jgi:Uma2 family endonuclease
MAEIIHDNTITLHLPRVLTAGEIVAVDVPEAVYMEQYAETHHEWVKGVVIKMSPVKLIHDRLVSYLRKLLEAYFSVKPIGTVVGDPFVMRLADSNRQPDIQVILGDNRANLKDTYMDGAANICIEVVSPGSVRIDYGEKLEEYENGGVTEYWLLDPLRQVCIFHRMTEEKLYRHVSLENNSYTTPLLPKFSLHVPTLWQDDLPDYGQVWEMVRAMFGKTDS